MTKKATIKMERTADEYIKEKYKRLSGESVATKGEVLRRGGYQPSTSRIPKQVLESENFKELVEKKEVESGYREKLHSILDKYLDEALSRDLGDESLLAVNAILNTIGKFSATEGVEEDENEPFCLPTEICAKYKLNETKVELSLENSENNNKENT
jgi:hypothetical protein